MPKAKFTSLLFCITCLFLTILSHSIVVAAEWYENGTLHEATFQQWKNATHSNKVATCAGFILAALNDGYLLLENKNTLLNTQNTELLKTLAEILVNTSDAFINNSTHISDPVSGAALLSMLTLEWIKPDYLAFLASSARKTHSSSPNETSKAHNTHKENSNKRNIPVKDSNTQIISTRKYRRMSPTEGRTWVKTNIIPVMTFAEDELVDRFGQYEKSTTILSNKKTLAKYYFKRINITFFVVHETQTIIGFSDGKGFLE